MEILLLGIYAFFVWLIFFKFRLLPWNIISQVISFTIPVVGLTVLILMLNIVAPSSADVRVINYVVPINPRVNGLVTEVPIEPNRPISKGDVLFRLDATPFKLAVESFEAQIVQLQAQLITAQANQLSLGEQLKAAIGNRDSIRSRLLLSRQRAQQFKELASAGAGNRFDQEQAQADVASLEADLAAANAAEQQVRAKLAATTPDGELDEVAKVKVQIANAQAQLANARWELSQTEYRAPADGTVVSLALRPGAMAVQFPAMPAMSFVENEQWIMAVFAQNEVRKVKPGQEAEMALGMWPGRIIKCRVDSIMWATAQGQLPIGAASNNSGIAPIPPGHLAVRLLVDAKDKGLFLASGSKGNGAIYTDSGHAIQILRKVFMRVGAKLDWLILKLH